jgi:hypothetical protein
MTYQYKPLPVVEGADDIYVRLLRLPPGPRFGPINCSILVTRLSVAPEFEAVSYCWRPSSSLSHDSDTIYVTNEDDTNPAHPGAALRVPGSIIPFLYRTRGHRVPRTRTFWIDSICINQDDTQERSVHVPKMREIYVKARATLSWLGPEGDRSTEAFKYASKLIKVLRKHMAKNGQLEISDEELKDTDDIKVTLGDPDLEALIKTLERPYFERAWIVQEVAVSEKISLICGDAVISWEQFHWAFTYLIRVTPWVFEFYPSHRMALLYTLRFSETDWQSSQVVEWYKVLLRHRSHKATDLRDKVYAYYGLRCKEGLRELGVKPDYVNTTTSSLYTALATNSLMARQSVVLHIPRFVTAGSPGDKDPDVKHTMLPSWAPDWQWTDQTPESLMYAKAGSGSEVPDFRASSDSDFKPVFDVQPDPVRDPDNYTPGVLPRFLRLRGFRVARITHSTASWTLQRPTGRQTLFEQARVLQENQVQIVDWESKLQWSNTSRVYSPTGENWMAAVYDTLIADTTYPLAARQAAAKGFEQRQRFLRLIPTFHLHTTIYIYCLLILAERFIKLFGYTNPQLQFRLMVPHMINRKGVRLAHETDAETEYLGLVPGISALNDSLFMIEGVRTPLVLRSKGMTQILVEDKGREDGRKIEKTVMLWEFIGDCYVHGLMDGKVWDRRAHECEDVWIA